MMLFYLVGWYWVSFTQCIVWNGSDKLNCLMMKVAFTNLNESFGGIFNTWFILHPHLKGGNNASWAKKEERCFH